MLSLGFKDQVYQIFQSIEKDVQIVLSSATFPNDVLEVTKKFMVEPVKILVKKEDLTLEGIKQFYINVEKEEWKYPTLMDIYSLFEMAQAIIFCNKKEIVEDLQKRLADDDFAVSVIHGEMSQQDRDKIMVDFRSGTTRLLITTDLLARGIDVQQVSLVINYDIPLTIENYLHRIGRSGRSGRKGVAINFVTRTEMRSLEKLQKVYDTVIEEMPTNVASFI